MVSLKAARYRRGTVAVTYVYHNVFYWRKNGTSLMETEHLYVIVYESS